MPGRKRKKKDGRGGEEKEKAEENNYEQFGKRSDSLHLRFSVDHSTPILIGVMSLDLWLRCC